MSDFLIRHGGQVSDLLQFEAYLRFIKVHSA